MSRWKEYLSFLDEGPHSVKILTSNLAPQSPVPKREDVSIHRLNYTLWPFQEKILRGMGPSTLILGLPTGLGKTYLAGAKLMRDSKERPIRVLFLVPSIPLGVQQTIFAKTMLNVNALFVSGEIPPQDRERLNVWNNGFVVTTPQTFYNDNLSVHEASLKEARKLEDPIEYLSGLMDEFPYDVVVADECQRYIGNTDGYSILLAAKACGSRILALSATPQLHAPERLLELRKVFDKIKIFTVEDPGIKEHMPERLVVMERIKTPKKLLRVYRTLGTLSRSYQFRLRKKYGRGHKRNCTEHGLCKALLAVKLLKFRMVEDGASSVIHYKTWRFKDLKNKRKSLNGESIHQAYTKALNDVFNHKISAATHILRSELYKKAIVYIESVMGAKHLAAVLHKNRTIEDTAVLVGKGDMNMDQQASALIHFKEHAKILVCTSVGEEGLDIPSADLEVWVDPPNNPGKWIQRFGRILRQPGDKKLAKIFALVSMQTHEKRKLLGMKKRVEETYGFTQRLKTRISKPIHSNQKTMTEYVE